MPRLGSGQLGATLTMENGVSIVLAIVTISFRRSALLNRGYLFFHFLCVGPDIPGKHHHRVFELRVLVVKLLDLPRQDAQRRSHFWSAPATSGHILVGAKRLVNVASALADLFDDLDAGVEGVVLELASPSPTFLYCFLLLNSPMNTRFRKLLLNVSALLQSALRTRDAPPRSRRTGCAPGSV